MDLHQLAITFFALVTLLCVAAIAALVWLAIAARKDPNSRLAEVRAALRPFALPIIFVVSVGSFLGSIYLSEIRNFTPCLLCWIQRVLLFPQMLLSGYLLWKSYMRRSSSWIALGGGITLALLTIPVSLYNYAIEWFPTLESSACTATGTSCTLVYVREFGFVTIPFMALTVSALVIALYMLAAPRFQAQTIAPTAERSQLPKDTVL